MPYTGSFPSDDGITIVHVYRDDRWFNLPSALLADLKVADYEIKCSRCEINYLCEPHRNLIESTDPGCIYIY